MSRRTIAAVLLTLLCLPPVVRAADPPALDRKTEVEVRALAAFIDDQVARRCAENDVKEAAVAGDAEFFRRLCLDLGGRIPSITEIRDFLDDDRKDKRRIWVEKLLHGEQYASHFANVWRAQWLASAPAERLPDLSITFENWLKPHLRNNTGYDLVVRELISAGTGPGSTAAAAFFEANERKAENLAGSTARLFLGVNIDCAQCHAHPFARWTRTQFWEFAAFFAAFDGEGRRPNSSEIAIPGTDKVARARFLDGKGPALPPGVDPRTPLSAWVTAQENPYFARAAVNRVWAYFFGLGLVEPLDEMSDQNPASHPELLEELTRQFVAHKYDLKFLIRAVVASDAYQRTSAVVVGRSGDAPGVPGLVPSAAVPEARAADARLFAHMAVRGLSPEQLFDSLSEAIDSREYANDRLRRDDGRGGLTPRQAYLAKFATLDRRTETQTSILQALFMMNGKFMAAATSLEGNRNLAGIIDSNTTPARRIETLYLVVLSRKPRPEEAERALKYVESGGPSGDGKKAMADLFWALLNSGEFMLNH
jgi:hypothetical protein